MESSLKKGFIVLFSFTTWFAFYFSLDAGSSISSLEAATEKFPDTLSTRCNEVSSLWAPCLCTLETCIGWYPCGLKYCKGRGSQGGADSSGAQQQTNYRCGIKTCRKCTQFTYYVRQKQQCLWDEWRRGELQLMQMQMRCARRLQNGTDACPGVGIGSETEAATGTTTPATKKGQDTMATTTTTNKLRQLLLLVQQQMPFALWSFPVHQISQYQPYSHSPKQKMPQRHQHQVATTLHHPSSSSSRSTFTSTSTATLATIVAW